MTKWQIEDEINKIACDLERGEISRTLAACDLRKLLKKIKKVK